MSAPRIFPKSLLAGLLLVAGLTVSAAEPTFPALTGRIVDNANLLSPALSASLNEKLADLEAKTTDQLVIVTLPSLDGYDIADYGYQLGRHWAIGQKDKNNGVLLIVAPNERKVRIEVGYGLEGTLTDALTRVIIETSILPHFRAGDMAAGIVAGSDDIIRVLAGDAQEIAERAVQSERGPVDFGALIFWIVLIIVILNWILRSGGGPGGKQGRKRSAPWIIVPGSGSGGGWSGGSGGGGGFSGGGGSFGGGGSSGSW